MHHSTMPQPRVPAFRVAQHREAATEAGWPGACPDRRCAALGACRGRLRAFPGWGRCLPGCLHLIVRAMHGDEPLSPEDETRFEEMLTLSGLDGPGEDRPVTGALAVLLFMAVLGDLGEPG